MVDKKILIVDDEEDFGRMLKLNLEKTGRYIVRLETKGKKALQSAQMFRPDLVILDVMMPDLMGNKVAEQIKADNEFSRVPIIFLTAVVKEGEVEEREGKISGYPCLAKPINIEKLIEAIEYNTY
ncbi:MAG: response regulator [Candidatus Margulisiibacteriota bacterium]